MAERARKRYTEHTSRTRVLTKSFSDLFEESNTALLAFLKTELSLGFTFAGMAKAYGGKANRERYEASKRNAIAALQAIAQFKERLSDTARSEIDHGHSELEKFISSL